MDRMMKRHYSISLLLLVSLSIPAAVFAGVEVVSATYARGMTESYQPVDPTVSFLRGETIYLCLEFRGQSLKGVISARFMFGDDEIAMARTDFSGTENADPSSDLNTTVGFTLRQVEKFPVGTGYRADVFHDGAYLGSWFFRIDPPAGSLPSFVRSAALTRAIDDDFQPTERTTLFAPADTVYITGVGDTGLDSWLQAEWIVSGVLDEEGTRNLTMLEDSADNGFTFYYCPEGGWPLGEHAVILKLNGQVVCRLPFSVR